MAADPAHRIRPLSADDAGTIDAVLSLNRFWVPHVGELDRHRLVGLVGSADLSVVVDADSAGVDSAGVDGAILGFMILVAPGSDYASPNYRFFQQRLESGAAPGTFLYVDRIAVDPVVQGTGLGRALYEAAFERATQLGAAEVTCEVNVDPPNPDSQAFHTRMGFAEVDRQWTYDHTVEVQLLARRL